MRRSILEKLTPDQRNYPAKNGIDPGLLNYRRLLGFLPKRVTQRIVDAAKRDEPAAKLGTVAFDHFLTEEALAEWYDAKDER